MASILAWAIVFFTDTALLLSFRINVIVVVSEEMREAVRCEDLWETSKQIGVKISRGEFLRLRRCCVGGERVTDEELRRGSCFFFLENRAWSINNIQLSAATTEGRSRWTLHIALLACCEYLSIHCFYTST